MRTLANAASFVLALSVALAAQAPSRLADAKREGTLTLYTSLAPTESTPLAAAFEKKYGVKVQLWRGLSEEVVQRTITEARGRRYAVDVIETNGPEMEMIGRERLLASAWSPDRLNLFVVGYNTAKVKRAEIPATYEGFADPKWKGRIALEATDSEWMATLIKTTPGGKGMDLMRRLAALQPSLRKGHVLLASLVAAGDVPVGLAKNAPHPNAAQLFSEYVMSPEGQKLFESMGRVPASPGVNSALNNFPFVLI